MKEWYIFINGKKSIYEIIVNSKSIIGAFKKAKEELSIKYGNDYEITKISLV